MMTKTVTLISDLKIENEYTLFTVKSDAEQIVIRIECEKIPKLNLPLRKLINIKNSLPINTDQLVIAYFNEKEIYRSDRSLFKKYNYYFLIKLFIKNRF